MIPKRQYGLKFGSDEYKRWFWSNVDRVSQHWRWLGSLQTRKRLHYGNCWRDGRWDKAHRVAWELATGWAVPDGLVVMHLCDHGWCVNPDHLVVGTVAANNWDRARKGRNGGAAPVDVEPPPHGQLPLV